MAVSKKLIDQAGKFSTATLYEALDKYGNLPRGIKPINPKMKICGPAYTVKTMPGDNMLLHRAYAYAQPGDILVVDCSGFYDAAYWGDLSSLGAHTRGIAGLVIDGCVRDADEIEEIGFPVFCRGLSILGSTKHGTGTLNLPIILGGWQIQPGDIIVGDRDGVVVVPQNRLKEAIEKATVEEAREEEIKKQLRTGKNSIQIFGWDKKYGF